MQKPRNNNTTQELERNSNKSMTPFIQLMWMITLLAVSIVMSLYFYEALRLLHDNQPDLRITFYGENEKEGTPAWTMCDIRKPDEQKYNYCILAKKELLIKQQDTNIDIMEEDKWK